MRRAKKKRSPASQLRRDLELAILLSLQSSKDDSETRSDEASDGIDTTELEKSARIDAIEDQKYADLKVAHGPSDEIRVKLPEHGGAHVRRLLSGEMEELQSETVPTEANLSADVGDGACGSEGRASETDGMVAQAEMEVRRPSSISPARHRLRQRLEVDKKETGGGDGIVIPENFEIPLVIRNEPSVQTLGWMQARDYGGCQSGIESGLFHRIDQPGLPLIRGEGAEHGENGGVSTSSENAIDRRNTASQMPGPNGAMGHVRAVFSSSEESACESPKALAHGGAEIEGSQNCFLESDSPDLDTLPQIQEDRADMILGQYSVPGLDAGLSPSRDSETDSFTDGYSSKSMDSETSDDEGQSSLDMSSCEISDWASNETTLDGPNCFLASDKSEPASPPLNKEDMASEHSDFILSDDVSDPSIQRGGSGQCNYFIELEDQRPKQLQGAPKATEDVAHRRPIGPRRSHDSFVEQTKSSQVPTPTIPQGRKHSESEGFFSESSDTRVNPANNDSGTNEEPPPQEPMEKDGPHVFNERHDGDDEAECFPSPLPEDVEFTKFDLPRLDHSYRQESHEFNDRVCRLPSPAHVHQETEEERSLAERRASLFMGALAMSIETSQRSTLLWIMGLLKEEIPPEKIRLHNFIDFVTGTGILKFNTIASKILRLPGNDIRYLRELMLASEEPNIRAWAEKCEQTAALVEGTPIHNEVPPAPESQSTTQAIADPVAPRPTLPQSQQAAPAVQQQEQEPEIPKITIDVEREREVLISLFQAASNNGDIFDTGMESQSRSVHPARIGYQPLSKPDEMMAVITSQISFGVIQTTNHLRNNPAPAFYNSVDVGIPAYLQVVPHLQGGKKGRPRGRRPHDSLQMGDTGQEEPRYEEGTEEPVHLDTVLDEDNEETEEIQPIPVDPSQQIEPFSSYFCVDS